LVAAFSLFEVHGLIPSSPPSTKGAYSTHLNVAEYLVRKLPDSWSFQEGAAFLVNSITVWYGMKSLGDLRKGTAVLVHSASGGCGLQALAICQKVGAIAVGTVGSPQKLELVLRRNPLMRRYALVIIIISCIYLFMYFYLLFTRKYPILRSSSVDLQGNIPYSYQILSIIY
jgi:hypothetical protein